MPVDKVTFAIRAFVYLWAIVIGFYWISTINTYHDDSAIVAPVLPKRTIQIAPCLSYAVDMGRRGMANVCIVYTGSKLRERKYEDSSSL